MICFRNCHFIALAVLLFSVASWGACDYFPSGTHVCESNGNMLKCSGLSLPSNLGDCSSGCSGLNAGCGSSRFLAGCEYTGNTQCRSYDSWVQRAYRSICCSTQSEADSVICVNGGDNWVNGECKGPIDSTVCDLAKARCDKLGGVFEGHPLEDGCSSSCNTCGTQASKNILKVKSESCCAQYLAPEVEQMCNTPIQSGVGETYSTNANLTCADPSLSEEAASAYAEYCSGDYDWDENSSSSGGEGGSSSSGGSSGEEGSSGEAGSAGLENDYYPILDTIRDTLIDIKRNVANIYTCLITPSACAGLSSGQKSGDTVIVNVPSDSVKLNDISGKLTVLDTSIQNSTDRLLEGISRGNDTLIDSMRKYLQNLESVGFSGDTLGDSLGEIHSTLKEIEGLLNGEEVDTSGYSSWGDLIAEGESLGDSIGIVSGWTDGLDSVDIDSVYAAAVADSLNVDSIGESIDSALQKRLDSLHSALKESIDSNRTSLLDSMDVWADTIAALAPFADFDSLIYSTIGSRVPNTDQCPENCQKWAINLPGFGLVNYSVDFGLCLGRSVLGNLSVLGFLRLLVRLVVVWTCIWFVIWNFTRKKD